VYPDAYPICSEAVPLKLPEEGVHVTVLPPELEYRN